MSAERATAGEPEAEVDEQAFDPRDEDDNDAVVPAAEQLHDALREPGQRPGAEPADEGAGEQRPDDVKPGDELPGTERHAEQTIDEIAEVPDVGREDAAGRGEKRDQHDVADIEAIARLPRGRLHVEPRS